MNNIKVADMTVDELRGVIRETVAQALAELFNDPDEGLALRDKFSKELIAALNEPKPQYKEAQNVADKLGLDW